MTSILLPEIAMSSLRLLSEAVERDSTDLLAVSNLHQVAVGLQTVAGNLRAFWNEVRACLARVGMQGQVLRKNTSLFLECLERLSRLLTTLEKMARQSGPAAGDVSSIVSEAQAATQILIGEISEVHAVVSRPLDSGFLERAAKAIAQDSGDYISHDEMLAGLQDGDH
jgi:hypothetical protein